MEGNKSGSARLTVLGRNRAGSIPWFAVIALISFRLTLSRLLKDQAVAASRHDPTQQPRLGIHHFMTQLTHDPSDTTAWPNTRDVAPSGSATRSTNALAFAGRVPVNTDGPQPCAAHCQVKTEERVCSALQGLARPFELSSPSGAGGCTRLRC